MTAPLELNPYSHDFHNDPYPTYHRLREEAPAYYNDKLKFWALSRHKDVDAAFKNWKLFSSREGVALETLGESVSRVMSIIGMDPPIHNDIRKIVVHVFTAKQMDAMEEGVRRTARRYLEEMKRKTAAGEVVDFIEDFAGKLPMDVISDMLGVPAVDRDKVRNWANTMMDRLDGSEEIPPHAMEASGNILTYFSKLVEHRRQHGLGDDLTGQFMDAELDGNKLADEDVVSFLFLMCIAGNETTTKMLGNALYWAQKFPDQLEKVKQDNSRVSDWVEETLRFDNSSQILYRTVEEDVELHGKQIKSGDRIALLVGSANRDPRVFDNPDVYNFDRECSQSMSFGKGVHFCLGARLARLEGAVCLEEFMNVVEEFEYKESELVRIHNSNVRGFLHMPVKLKFK